MTDVNLTNDTTPRGALSRRQVRRTLLKRRGASSDLAVRLGLTRQSVSLVLRGYSTSARVMAAAEEMAKQIVAEGSIRRGTGNV